MYFCLILKTSFNPCFLSVSVIELNHFSLFLEVLLVSLKELFWILLPKFAVVSSYSISCGFSFCLLDGSWFLGESLVFVGKYYNLCTEELSIYFRRSSWTSLLSLISEISSNFPGVYVTYVTYVTYVIALLDDNWSPSFLEAHDWYVIAISTLESTSNPDINLICHWCIVQNELGTVKKKNAWHPLKTVSGNGIDPCC